MGSGSAAGHFAELPPALPRSTSPENANDGEREAQRPIYQDFNCSGGELPVIFLQFVVPAGMIFVFYLMCFFQSVLITLITVNMLFLYFK